MIIQNNIELSWNLKICDRAVRVNLGLIRLGVGSQLPVIGPTGTQCRR